jgi:microcystin-dependent protein
MDPFIAEIVMFGGNFAPRGWAKCEGQLLSIASNPALFSIIGTMYGGDGRTTFGLPDLRGRVPVSPGQGPGLSNYNQGPGGGHEQAFLTIANMPSHNHIASGTVKASFTPPSGGGSTNNPGGNNLSGIGGTNIYSANPGNVSMAANNVDITVANSGGSQPFSVVQPWCAVQFIIATVGVFPSRS